MVGDLSCAQSSRIGEVIDSCDADHTRSSPDAAVTDISTCVQAEIIHPCDAPPSSAVTLTRHGPRTDARPRPAADQATARDPMLGSALRAPIGVGTVVLRPGRAKGREAKSRGDLPWLRNSLVRWSPSVSICRRWTKSNIRAGHDDSPARTALPWCPEVLQVAWCRRVHGSS